MLRFLPEPPCPPREADRFTGIKRAVYAERSLPAQSALRSERTQSSSVAWLPRCSSRIERVENTTPELRRERICAVDNRREVCRARSVFDLARPHWRQEGSPIRKESVFQARARKKSKTQRLKLQRPVPRVVAPPSPRYAALTIHNKNGDNAAEMASRRHFQHGVKAQRTLLCIRSACRARSFLHQDRP